MPQFRTAIAFSLSLIVSVAIAQDEPKPDPREQIDTAVGEAIRLLKAKDHKTLLEKFVPPEELKQITKRTTIDKFASEFAAGDKAATLLKVLEGIQGAKPKLSDDGSEATFELKEPVSTKSDIRFKKIGKYWYIQN